MIAEVLANQIRCPHCHSTDPARFRLQRRATWLEPIRELFPDKGVLVLIAECDQPQVGILPSPDELLCLNCNRLSTLDVNVLVHHEDPKV